MMGPPVKKPVFPRSGGVRRLDPVRLKTGLTVRPIQGVKVETLQVGKIGSTPAKMRFSVSGDQEFQLARKLLTTGKIGITSDIQYLHGGVNPIDLARRLLGMETSVEKEEVGQDFLRVARILTGKPEFKGWTLRGKMGRAMDAIVEAAHDLRPNHGIKKISDRQQQVETSFKILNEIWRKENRETWIEAPEGYKGDALLGPRLRWEDGQRELPPDRAAFVIGSKPSSEIMVHATGAGHEYAVIENMRGEFFLRVLKGQHRVAIERDWKSIIEPGRHEMPLSAEFSRPSLLMHGDKIRINDREIIFETPKLTFHVDRVWENFGIMSYRSLYLGLYHADRKGKLSASEYDQLKNRMKMYPLIVENLRLLGSRQISDLPVAKHAARALVRLGFEETARAVAERHGFTLAP